MIIDRFLASLAYNQALSFEPCQRLFDKGKPVERRGRKAMDLRSPKGDYDSQVTEDKTTRVFGRFERLYR